MVRGFWERECERVSLGVSERVFDDAARQRSDSIYVRPPVKTNLKRGGGGEDSELNSSTGSTRLTAVGAVVVVVVLLSIRSAQSQCVHVPSLCLLVADATAVDLVSTTDSTCLGDEQSSSKRCESQRPPVLN
jgi:hypothetical protein